MARILIIEDEEFYGEFLGKIVRKKYPCDWAQSGEDAKALLKKQPYDVVLYDLRLPGSSGKDLIRYVKESVDSDTVNIVITGFEKDWPAVEATGEHIFFYMRKGSFKPEDLLKVLENAVELRQLRRREAEFMRNYLAAEKLASAGKLAVSIAHEINNPLQGMVSILDVMKNKLEEQTGAGPSREAPAGEGQAGSEGSGAQSPGSLAPDLEILERSVERIRKVVRRLNELQGVDYPTQGVSAGTSEGICPLNTVTEQVVSFIRPIARERNTKLSFRGNHRVDTISVSEKQFFQVLLNTCMNLLDGNNESIELATGKAHNKAVLTISTVRRDPEKRSDASFEITKNIIQSLRGNFEVQEGSSGETITIAFPAQNTG
jgi:signal transduction histidine kinase